MFINPPTFGFSLLKWPYFDLCSYVLKPIVLFFGLTHHVLYIFFMGNMSHTACCFSLQQLAPTFSQGFDTWTTQSMLEWFRQKLKQPNCIIWYCVFEHGARLSCNPGRSQPSQCPIPPSASVLGSLPLQLRSENWRWHRCRFWMRMTKEMTLLSQKLRLPP